MKLIEVLIRPTNLDEVKSALQEIGINEIGIEEIMVSQHISNSLKKGKSLLYRGTEYIPDFIAKMRVEIIAEDGLVDKIVKTIRKIAGTDRKENCRIFILPLIEAF